MEITPKFIRKNISLAPHTTIKLGGPARYFAVCTNETEVISAIDFAAQNSLPVMILGGGSNVVFSDRGFSGLVIKPKFKKAPLYHGSIVKVDAGVPWDEFVSGSLSQGLGGLESLSGIPGTVGAAPVQNIGAYGVEVSELITGVQAIDTASKEVVAFNNQECDFSYRNSRFKGADHGRYIITSVTFQLFEASYVSPLTYPPLRDSLASSLPLPPGPKGWQKVRASVLSLRQKKSMVISEQDPHSQSCGSFFVNLLFTPAEFSSFQQKTQKLKLPEPPAFPSHEKIKVPAAWIIEHAGFPKGYRAGNVGISANHNLALVNYGGTTAQLLALARKIQVEVKSKFAVNLTIEPEIIP